MNLWKGTEIMKVTPTMQELYYASSHWREMSRRRKDMDGWKCVQCAATDNLHTHHWRYFLFNESVHHDLLTLCKSCHQAIHDAISGSSVHFPHTVEKWISDRLTEPADGK